MNIKTVITIICIMASLSGCGQTNSNATKNTQTMNNSIEKQAAATEQSSQTADKGVVINGVKWATRNVDMPNTFAATPESFGKFYQWNRKVAWNSTDSIVSGWRKSIPNGITWERVNEPSPAGWRVPASEEIEKLLDTEKVTNEWTTQNGVNGRKFTDKASGNSIFLPAAGFRQYDSGALVGAGNYGAYWSSTQYLSVGAYGLFFKDDDAYLNVSDRKNGFFVRCVAE